MGHGGILLLLGGAGEAGPGAGSSSSSSLSVIWHVHRAASVSTGPLLVHLETMGRAWGAAKPAGAGRQLRQSSGTLPGRRGGSLPPGQSERSPNPPCGGGQRRLGSALAPTRWPCPGQALCMALGQAAPS